MKPLTFRACLRACVRSCVRVCDSNKDPMQIGRGGGKGKEVVNSSPRQLRLQLHGLLIPRRTYV